MGNCQVRRSENSKSDLSFLLQMFFYVKFNFRNILFSDQRSKMSGPDEAVLAAVRRFETMHHDVKVKSFL